MRILRVGQKILRIGGTVRDVAPRGGAIIPWYLAGGVSAANCIAAYQPKGAADYAASKVNLANPGTYNATDGTAYPDWNASTGWKGDGLSSAAKVLKTGITGYSNSWSLIAKYTNAAASYDVMLGAEDYSGGYRYFALGFFHLAPTQRWWVGGSYTAGYQQALTASGVAAIAGAKAYLDGAYLGDITTGNMPTSQLCIMAGDASGIRGFIGYLHAAAIYNIGLTAAQVSAITTRMNAL